MLPAKEKSAPNGKVGQRNEVLQGLGFSRVDERQAKDLDTRQLALQKKEKLRVYRTLKFNLKQEEYISWSLPAEHMSHFAKLRSGSHHLRVEKGRWKEEQEEDRVCLVCLTGKVENELHFLLDCYVNTRLRQNLDHRITQRTG